MSLSSDLKISSLLKSAGGEGKPIQGRPQESLEQRLKRLELKYKQTRLENQKLKAELSNLKEKK